MRCKERDRVAASIASMRYQTFIRARWKVSFVFPLTLHICAHASLARNYWRMQFHWKKNLRYIVYLFLRRYKLPYSSSNKIYAYARVIRQRWNCASCSERECIRYFVNSIRWHVIAIMVGRSPLSALTVHLAARLPARWAKLASIFTLPCTELIRIVASNGTKYRVSHSLSVPHPRFAFDGTYVGGNNGE